MAELKTTFAGLHLKNPIIVSSSGLTNSVEKNKSGIRALDLFAGTGSISIELLSRGCDQVVSVEKALN